MKADHPDYPPLQSTVKAIAETERGTVAKCVGQQLGRNAIYPVCRWRIVETRGAG